MYNGNARLQSLALGPYLKDDKVVRFGEIVPEI